MTRALFVKDGYKGIPPEQRSSDWLIADFKDTFDMQKTRSINAVGIDETGEPIKLPQVINGDNYDEKELIEYVINQFKKNKSKK